MTFRPCAIVPTYENPKTIRKVVMAIRKHDLDVVVVDDGCGPEARAVCESLADEGLAHVHHRQKNGGKGAAVKTGLTVASERGFSHALQIDADLQHDADDIPRFIEAARQNPDALVLGTPVFDDSAPWVRLAGRQLTVGLTHAQTFGRVIKDPMCGFRVYPLEHANAVRVRGNAMDFDPEIAVKMHWYGVPIINLPTRVRYNEDGVSHFRQVRDNLLLAWMHVRLCVFAFFCLLGFRGTTRTSRARETWLSTKERGGVLGLRFVIFLCTVGGRTLARLLMRPVAVYYAIVHGTTRRASRTYLERLHGAPASFWAVVRHILHFAYVAVDRFFLVKRRLKYFEFTETGKDHLRELQESRTGAILLGAHFGSFEAMRVLSADSQLPLNVVGYFRNAKVINSALERLDPESKVRLIEVDPASISFVFHIKKCIERGELVAILGDRIGLGESTVTVNFLGRPAPLPSGVYALAAVLHCPVYFTAALYREPNKYDLLCEPFADSIVLKRGKRQKALQTYAQQYADRLEHHCRTAPENWFNFFDFWKALPQTTHASSSTKSVRD